MDLLNTVFQVRNSTSFRPDFERVRRAATSLEPGPVPVGEFFADPETVGAYLNERVFDYSKLAADPSHRITPKIFYQAFRYVNQSVRFCLDHGWDYAYCFSMIQFPDFTYKLAENTAETAKDRKRYWKNQHEGPIQSWDDFERYPWPADLGLVNLMARIMTKTVPDGMKVFVIPQGIFELAYDLMGFEPFCMALAEQPQLVEAVVKKVADNVQRVVEDLMEMPKIGGIFLGDDWGYTTGTMISPKQMRSLIMLPMKRMIDLVHSAGKLFFFHTCGNMYALMDDLIEAGIDGKHSYEDKILPVEKAHEKWSRQTAILGGVDIHILASGTEEDVRRRTREILDACGPRGRYLLGTGNSVANYIPLRNYQAMLDEGRQWNRDHFGRDA